MGLQVFDLSPNVYISQTQTYTYLVYVSIYYIVGIYQEVSKYIYIQYFIMEYFVRIPHTWGLQVFDFSPNIYIPQTWVYTYLVYVSIYYIVGINITVINYYIQ